MKLDPRIVEGKKPLDCFDAEESEKFVGQNGYASYDISTFTDLDFCEPGKLEYVVKEDGKGICYPYCVVTDYDRKEYAFFLPEAWTIEVEKKDEIPNVVPTEIVMKEYYKLKKRYKKVLDYLKDK